MKKLISTRLISLTLWILVTSCSIMAQNMPYPKSKDLPDHFVFYDQDRWKDLPAAIQSVCSIQDFSSLNNNSVNHTDPLAKKAIANFHFWLKEMIQPQWIPTDLDERLILAPGSMNGDDAIWARFRFQEYAIQIVSDYCQTIIMVKTTSDSALPILENTEQAGVQAVATIERIFNRADEIKKNHSSLQSSGRLVCSTTIIGLGRPSIDWYITMKWWTDGNTTTFQIAKSLGIIATYPSKTPHWFTPDE